MSKAADSESAAVPPQIRGGHNDLDRVGWRSSANTWYHASATYDGSTMRLYLTGPVGSVAKSGSISRSSGRVSVEIGRSPESSDYLRGAIDDVRIYSSALTPAEIAALAGTGVSGNQLSNQPPTVSLTAPASDSTFTIPASITLSATASDVDGTIAGVDFYAGPVLLGTDASSPYSVSWTERVAASYPIVAVARDGGGASTVSSTRDIMVIPAGLPRTAVFAPATDHATAVDRYVFEVFPLGANTTVANPGSHSGSRKAVDHKRRMSRGYRGDGFRAGARHLHRDSHSFRQRWEYSRRALASVHKMTTRAHC